MQRKTEGGFEQVYLQLLLNDKQFESAGEPRCDESQDETNSNEFAGSTSNPAQAAQMIQRQVADVLAVGGFIVWRSAARQERGQRTQVK
jgi:hypothetical protein